MNIMDILIEEHGTKKCIYGCKKKALQDHCMEQIRAYELAIMNSGIMNHLKVSAAESEMNIFRGDYKCACGIRNLHSFPITIKALLSI